MSIPVWLDTDPGVDDLATMLMLAADPEIELLGISAVGGNAPIEAIIDNALRIKAFFGLRAPIHAGSPGPRAVTAEGVLGDGGLRSRNRTLPATHLRLDSSDGIGAMGRAIRDRPGAVTLVAIGPLTNLAIALTEDPGLAGQVREIVLMGGSTDRGNHSAVAEFNIAADPEAAAIVFASGAPIRMFGLNLCRQVLLGLADLAPLEAIGNERALTLADYLADYVCLAAPDGSRPMAVYDPVTAAFLARPALFGFEPAHVEIELAGTHTRGMTVCEFRVPARGRPNAQVAMRADGPAVIRLMMARLASAVG